MAVGKARFSELKTTTKVFQQAAQRYYMINGTYEGINGNINKVLDVELPAGSDCQIWDVATSDSIRCCRYIFNKKMCFYISRERGIPNSCLAVSADTTDLANRLCQKETGKARGDCSSGSYCNYAY